jgi:subtilisin family serine protease
MTDDERGRARTLMPGARETDAYLLGEASEQTIGSLQQEGLIVQRVGAQPQPPGLESLAFETSATRSLGLGPQTDTKPNFYLVTIDGPLLPADREDLERLGVEPLENVPPDSFTAHLTPAQVEDVRKLDCVSAVSLFRSGMTETGDTTKTRGDLPLPSHLAAPERAKEMLSFDVVLQREQDLQTVLDKLAENNIVVGGAKGKKIRVHLLEESGDDDVIRGIDGVYRVERYYPPKLHNDRARVILGVDDENGGAIAAHVTQTGAGQIVGVADTGLDDTHGDFQGRIVGTKAFGRPPNDSSDPNGHGTHVAGSILGSGAESKGAVKGVAPEAELYFQSILRADGDLELPIDLGDLFEDAYANGARIHNNSWGSATSSRYTLNATEVDAFVAKNRDMLIVISAGNEGTASANKNAETGFVDLLSVGSPASCKNALTVGASRSDRTSGGYATITWGQAWPDSYPDPPIANENTSGDIQRLAAFSSRGPIDDRRIKPDVVAPGTNILSTRSSKAPLRNYWGSDPNLPKYAYNGGTSMAAPLVAGCAALVRQYYVDDRQHPNPSAALLKATLINSTRFLSGPDSIAGHPKCPNHHQGFGMIDMRRAIPTANELRLEFVDSWALTPPVKLPDTGSVVRYRFTADAGPIRICLAWTDPPGRSLLNNLDLFVQMGGRKWTGNADAPLGLVMPDPDNNVEIVRIDDAAAGTYTIQITATNLLQRQQDFALVVTGALTSALTRF